MLASSLWSRPSKDYLSALNYGLWFHTIFFCQKINKIEVNNKYSLGDIGQLRLCAFVLYLYFSVITIETVLRNSIA